MSKRRSKSAKFIGTFHNLQRNVIDPETHVARWRGHVERWIRQVQRIDGERQKKQQLLAAAKARRASKSELQALEAELLHLLDKEQAIVAKIEGTLPKIAAMGHAAKNQDLWSAYRAFTSKAVPQEPEDEDPAEKPLHGLTGKARAAALRSRVRSWAADRPPPS